MINTDLDATTPFGKLLAMRRRERGISTDPASTVLPDTVTPHDAGTDPIASSSARPRAGEEATTSGGRMPMPTRLLSATVGLALAFTLAACGGDDEPDPIPGGTGTPSPEASVSPPPTDTPDLDADQQADYDAAVAQYDEFEAFSSRVSEDPEGTPLEVAAKVSDFTTKTGMQTWADSVDSLVAAGIRIEGERKTEWTVPVSVTDKKIVLRRCESPGTWTAYQDGESTRESGNAVTKVTLAYADDAWRFDGLEGDGEC